MELDRLVLRCRGRLRDFYVRRNTSDNRVIGQIFIDLAFDITRLRRFSELQALLAAGRAAGKRPLIVDAGANIGATSVYLSLLCPDALVVAIEPEPRNFQLLVENTRGLPVLPLPCALAATSQPVQIEDPGEGEWGYRTRSFDAGADGSVAVSAVTVDEILEAHSDTCFPFIVKIDIEGGERELFASHTAWIDSVPLLIIELHDWLLPRHRISQPFLRRLAKSDRDLVHIGENIFTMPIELMQQQSEPIRQKLTQPNTGCEGKPVDTYNYIRRLAAEQAQRGALQDSRRDFEDSIEVLQSQAEDARAEAARAAEALAEVQNHLRAVIYSTSWRLLAPLRAVGSRHPRMARGLRRSVKVIWRITAPLRWLLAAARTTGRGHGGGWDYERQTAAIEALYLNSASENVQPLHLALDSAHDVHRILSAASLNTKVSASVSPARYSIVTPYFQHRDFFRSCAESVAALMLMDAETTAEARIEWIVVNDDPRMPDDDLRSIIPLAAQPHTRILSDGRNHGIAASLNRGVAEAANPWILFLDCDDRIEAVAPKVVDRHIARSPRCRYFSSAMIDIDSEDRELRRRMHEASPTMLFERGNVMGHLKAIRRDLIEELHGFDWRFSGAQDYDFALRAAACEPLEQIDEHLYAYRWHDATQSARRANRQARLTDAIRATFLRRTLCGPQAPQISAPPPAKLRGLCVIRTQGNRLELLAQAVTSVQAQELPVTPCVVVHGTEEARSEVEAWLIAQGIAGLIVLHTPNTDRRRGHACNVALDYLKEHSEAYDLLCFLDDDDYLLPPFAERLAAALGLTGADLAYCGSNAVPAQGEPYVMHGMLPAVALFGGNFIPINAYAVRTEAVLAANARFDETIDYLEDWDFLVQLMAAGVRAVPVFETLSEFRLIGDGNSMQRRDPVHFDHCLARVRGNAAAAAARLPVALFWRDVLDFPSERRLALKTAEIAHLQAAKRLFAGASAP